MIRNAVVILTLAVLAGSPSTEAVQVPRSSKYEDLVSLFKAWREFQKPKMRDHVPDYTPAAMAEQHRGLQGFKSRLDAIDPSGWPIPQQVDWHIVRAEMNGLDFDHRVLRPWSRNPVFYKVVHASQSDTPSHEGTGPEGALELWTYRFPLAANDLPEVRAKLEAIPKILEQAKNNLVEDARDLWFFGIRVKKSESATLGELAERVRGPHPDLVPDVQKAKAAVDDFTTWLEGKHKTMKAPSGVGVENYNWYLKNVHLVPFTWEQIVTILERELHRGWAQLKLEENRNRRLPKLQLAANEPEFKKRSEEALAEYKDFLAQEEVLTVRDYMEGALRARLGTFMPASGGYDFFSQVDYRDPFAMRLHGFHWIDLARMEREPHSSSIRRGPLRYNIWDGRAEGFATAMEEMMMVAGLLDKKPRARELIYILLANRAARAMGDVKMHSKEFTVEQAVKFACDWTPYGWLPETGNTVWFDEQIYLEQPGYGTSYVIGKVQVDELIADRAHQQGDKFTLKGFMDEFHAAGLIPISLIRWELTGLKDEIEKLSK